MRLMSLAVVLTLSLTTGAALAAEPTSDPRTPAADQVSNLNGGAYAASGALCAAWRTNNPTSPTTAAICARAKAERSARRAA